VNVTAPYNFVPLANLICTAEDLELRGVPLQDKPVEGNLSGSVPFTLTSDTPLLIGDGGEEKHFLKDPSDDGTPIIPGSSLRGMLRNVLEIASFARFSFVDDQRVGVRDLDAVLDYRSKMAGKTKAGWLRLEDDGPVLTCCEFGRTKHTNLDALSEGFSARVETLACQKDPEKRDAEKVNEAFLEKASTLDHSLYVQDHDDPKSHCRFAQTDQFEVASLIAGTLVFTGLPSDAKKKEFFFFGKGKKKAIPDEIWKKFIDVHEKQEKPSPTWVWRRKAYRNGEAIPVFWLPDENDEVSQIGLALMFKLAADNTTHDLIGEAHKKRDFIDLPTRIFGRVAAKDSTIESFKTRVSFGYAWLITKDFTSTPKRVIAAKPKPSFAPSYIRQKDFGNVEGTQLLKWSYRKRNGEEGQRKAEYRSYMNWGNNREELRGWKRYPAQGTEKANFADATDGGSSSILHPITGPNGLIFRGRIRFHNLDPVELGALIWVLTWGGSDKLRHGLGMGKPFGWGQVAIGLGDIEYTDTSPTKPPQETFTDRMEEWARMRAIPGGWVNSLQINGLLAMADPLLGKKRQRSHLRQMVLNPDMKRNDFLTAKAAAEVLPEYLPDGEFANQTVATKSNVKGGPEPQRSQARLQQNKKSPSRAGDFRLSEGGTAYYEGMKVEILRISMPDATIRYSVEDGSGDEAVPFSDLSIPS